jgi:hypothetical protein
VSVEQLAYPADCHSEQREHHREPEHEQCRPGDHPSAVHHYWGNGQRHDRYGTRFASDDRGGNDRTGSLSRICGFVLAFRVRALHARDVGQIAGHQRQAARRQEGNRPSSRSDRQGEQKRPRTRPDPQRPPCLGLPIWPGRSAGLTAYG